MTAAAQQFPYVPRDSSLGNASLAPMLPLTLIGMQTKAASGLVDSGAAINQPWATIPWKYSLTEARKLAAATKKPIFMVVGTGNPLGCG